MKATFSAVARSSGNANYHMIFTTAINSCNTVFNNVHVCGSVTVNWLDHSRTFREQGVDENETLLLRRKFFYSDQNVDSRDPVQLNLLYVQVQYVD